jgi:hypothetical protein
MKQDERARFTIQPPYKIGHGIDFPRVRGEGGQVRGGHHERTRRQREKERKRESEEGNEIESDDSKVRDKEQKRERESKREREREKKRETGQVREKRVCVLGNAKQNRFVRRRKTESIDAENETLKEKTQRAKPLAVFSASRWMQFH